MKTPEIQDRLREEAQAHTPDLKSKILAQAEKEGLFDCPPTAVKTERRSKERRPRRGLIATVSSLAVASACLAIVLPLALQSNLDIPTETHTIVCMQINPCVEFTVENDTVTQVRSLNKDSAVLLVHSNLVGKPIDEACLDFATLSKNRNLITDKGIGLYVSGEDEQDVEEKITQKLTESNYQYYRGAEGYATEVASLQEEYGVSRGKARIIVQLLHVFPNLSAQSLVVLPTEELYEILEDYKEGEMQAFEAQLLEEYLTVYPDFVAEVSTLLTEYEGELETLNGLEEGERNARIPAFNEKYQKLGDDFWVNGTHWAYSYNECKEELLEIKQDLSVNADEVFADLFEDWLEDFQTNRFER